MMRQTFRPPTSDSSAGFTLVEVIVAVAVTAMTTAAAASAILLSRSLAEASAFDQSAARAMVVIHAENYQLFGADSPDYPAESPAFEIVATTEIFPLTWKKYRLRQTGRNRSQTFSIAARPEP